MTDRLVAEITPSGRGAICVLAARSSAVAALVSEHFQPAGSRSLVDQPILKPVYGFWTDLPGCADSDREDVIVCRRSAEELEIHCHGGQFAKQRILAALSQLGFRQVPGTQFSTGTPRATGGTAEQACQWLSHTTTVMTAAVLNWQAGGALDRALRAIVEDLTSARGAAAAAGIRELLGWWPLGSHLIRHWQVLVAGQPNVGKSSLINQMLGYRRSIVFDQPGTTRDLVATSTAIDGWPVELIDSAGLRESEHRIESAGIALARQARSTADLTLVVHDATQWIGQTSPENGGSRPGSGVLLVMNKCDLANPEIPDSQQESWYRISARTGEGVPELMSAIARHLVPCHPLPGQAVPFLTSHQELLEQASQSIAADRLPQAIASIEQILAHDSGSAST